MHSQANNEEILHQHWKAGIHSQTPVFCCVRPMRNEAEAQRRDGMNDISCKSQTLLPRCSSRYVKRCWKPEPVFRARQSIVTFSFPINLPADATKRHDRKDVVTPPPPLSPARSGARETNAAEQSRRQRESGISRWDGGISVPEARGKETIIRREAVWKVTVVPRTLTRQGSGHEALWSITIDLPSASHGRRLPRRSGREDAFPAQEGNAKQTNQTICTPGSTSYPATKWTFPQHDKRWDRRRSIGVLITAGSLHNILTPHVREICKQHIPALKCESTHNTGASGARVHTADLRRTAASNPRRRTVVFSDKPPLIKTWII